MKYYLLIIHGGVEIAKAGPFDDEDKRLAHARTRRAGNPDDNIHWLDIEEDGSFEVGDFSNGALTGESC